MRVCAVMVLTALAAACGSSDEAPPVASVAVTLSKAQAPLGSPIDVSYRFEALPNAGIDGDYRVFMHLLDQDGVLRWADDHEPPTPTSQWKPGQPIEYTRTSFIPVVPYLGEAIVKVGLYKGDASGTRAPLQGPKPGEGRAYEVATLTLKPQSENIFVVLRSGFHQSEFAPENPAREWYWTQKELVANFKNPRKTSTLYLEFDARPDLFDQPQSVNVYLGSENVASLSASNKDPVLHRIALSPAQLGDADIVELRIVTDPSFIPTAIGAGTDIRELGIRVYHLFVDPS